MAGELKLTLPIKGREWEFILMGDKRFDKLYNPNGEGNVAMTLPNQYKVHFKKTDWCNADIIHELGHVLLTMSHMRSANVTVDDMEEIMCDIYAENYAEIGLWASRIAEKFFNRE